MATETPLSAPPPTSPTNRRRVGGILLLVFSVLATPVAALAVLLSANACGAFADGCDDYGKTADSFVPSLMFLCLSVTGVLAGIGLIVASRRR